jgi:hypothetical protein
MIRTVWSNLFLLKDLWKDFRIASIKQQLVDIAGLLRFALMLIAVGIVAIIGISAAYGVPVEDLTRDPAAVVNIPYYVGLLSNWGVMLWSAAAAVCLFSAWVLRGKQGTATSWLLASGMITLLLAVDDMFMLHEDVFPNVFGIHEKVVYAIYGILGFFYILYFLPEILKRRFVILAAACFFLGLSVLSDSIGRWFYVPTALEDSFKYIAIVLWLVFFIKSAYDEIASTQLVRRKPR